MHRIPIFPILGALLLSALGAAGAAPSGPRVLRHPSPESPLAERVEWGLGEARKLSAKDGAWIAYSFRRWTGEHSYFGRFDGPWLRNRQTLEDIVSTQPAPAPLPDDEVIRKAAEKALALSDPKRPAERMVWKDTALLIKIMPAGQGRPAAIYLSDLTLTFDLEGLSLFWLGPARDDDSIRYLEGLFDRTAAAGLKEDVLDAIGHHKNPDLVIPFLEKVLQGRGRDSLRGDAASTLGEQQDERAVVILKKTVRSDPSAEVRRRALWGLAETRLESAEDTVIDIALHAGSRELREESLEALAEIASRKSVAALEHAALDDPDIEVQESAVEALSELPGREGLPLLITMARSHHEPAIRKAAIAVLGESDDPRALETLIDLIKGRI